MSKCEASSCSSSIFTLHTLISEYSAEISSIIGENDLQGPHQLAQKSNSPGVSLSKTSFWKLFLLTTNTDLILFSLAQKCFI